MTFESVVLLPICKLTNSLTGIKFGPRKVLGYHRHLNMLLTAFRLKRNIRFSWHLNMILDTIVKNCHWLQLALKHGIFCN